MEAVTESLQRHLSSIDAYSGDNIEARVTSLIRDTAVIVFGRTFCPFTCDSIELLAENLQVLTHIVNLDVVSNGPEITAYLQNKTKRTKGLIPAIFVKGEFIGGCSELMRWHHSKTLERDILRGLVKRERTVKTEVLETANLAPIPRSRATLPLLLFPHTVNNHVSRVTALFLFVLSSVSAAFYYSYSERYLSLALILDFTLRFVAGDALSPLAMLASLLVSWKTPNFSPGAAKQLDVFIGVVLSALCVFFSFIQFPGNEIVACVFFVLIALLTGAEGFFKVSLGDKLLIERGIKLGIFPPYVYRVYNFTRPEKVETFAYKYSRPVHVSKPVKITTDRDNPVALRYKKKSQEWKLHDWDPIRMMHVHYFFCPLSLAALAMAFKISADAQQILGPEMEDMRLFVVPDAWFSFIACFGAFVLVFMLFLYMAKALLYPRKTKKERKHPARGSGLVTIPISFMIFAFLCYDELIDAESPKNSPAQVLGRVFFWIGSVSHALLCVTAVGDLIGRPFSLDNVHPHLLIYPFGLGFAGFSAPIIGPLPDHSDVANISLARFYFGFGWYLWILFSAITFLKLIVQPNPDNRLRHGVWIWLASSCVMGLAEYLICLGSLGYTKDARLHCTADLELYYFTGIFLVVVLLWISLPHIRYLSVESFNMWYWLDCFGLSMLASCAATFYVSTAWEISAVLEFMFLLIALATNFVALMHTLTCLMRKHDVCVPEPKLTPLTFLGLTHDAIRVHLPTVQYYLQFLNLEDTSEETRAMIGLFAAHFNLFRIVHGEHARQEDIILYKQYREYFPEHGRRWSEEHQKDFQLIGDWVGLVNVILDVNSRDRNEALQELRHELPAFFAHLARHFCGEEENMDPVGKKYLPLEVQKQIARDIFKATPSDRWEVIIPYVVTNLPFHVQRVCYLKSLCYAIPERTQQIGAIVYRHVDGILWERLRFDFPEMIPRGAPGWRRSH